MAMEPPQPGAGPVDAAHALQGFRAFLYIMAGVGVALLVGGWLYGGLDFAKGVLLGFLIVMVNAIWTKTVVQSILMEGKPRVLVSASYLLKLGLTGLVIYQAVTRFGMDGFSLLAGLSAILPGSVIFALTIKLEPEDPGKQ